MVGGRKRGVAESAESELLESGLSRAQTSFCCFPPYNPPPPPLTMASGSTRSSITPYLLYLVFVATLGPLQFGYHLVCPLSP